MRQSPQFSPTHCSGCSTFLPQTFLIPSSAQLPALTWVLSSDGTLTIDGTGAMDDYDNKAAYAPWIMCRDYIKTLWIGSGITYIGDCAFDSCYALTEIRYPGSEAQWNAIAVGANNQPLTSANIHYNYAPVALSGLVMDENGVWWYYIDGVLQSDFTGLVYFNDTFFYVQNGMLDTSYIGLVEFMGNWYYVEGGIINFAFTDLTYWNGTFFYIQNGVLDTSYVGLVEFVGAWYYVEGGIINFNFTGLTYFSGTFFYMQNGVLDTSFVGLVEFYGAWYYVSGGIIDFSYTGVFNFNGYDFNVVGGIVQF